MDLTTNATTSIDRLFSALPLKEAMAVLRPTTFRTEAVHVKSIDAPPEILAGLWLYVDDLDHSHTIAQSLDTATGSWWHAIIHRREGDFWNSKYWYRRVGAHPTMQSLKGFDPARFVDATEAANGNPDDLIELQRKEWKALFDWCLSQTHQ
jgi:hypothetical protein